MLQDIHRRLINAKYILSKAAIAQRERSEMSQGICVLLLHDATEILMIATLDHLNVVYSKKREFMDFWGLLKQAGHPDAPDHTAMESLNTIRVSLKHKAIIPNTRDVDQLVTRVRGFFENVLTLYCGLKLTKLSLVSLVPDPHIQEILKQAQDKFCAGDKNHAMVDLRIAFDDLHRRSNIEFPVVMPPAPPELSSEFRNLNVGFRSVDNYLKALTQCLRVNVTMTNIIALGMDPVRYYDFHQATPSIMYSAGSEYHISYSIEYTDCTQERFEELMSFVIEYALRINERYAPQATGKPQPAILWERIDPQNPTSNLKRPAGSPPVPA